MDVNSIVGQAPETDTSSSARSGNSLAKDFDNFLNLLTTQLQYQDPLAPMDSTQFTQQLVAFTGVEQSIATNKNLEAIIAQNKKSEASNAVGYLGKEIIVQTNKAGLTKEGTASWEYHLSASSNKTKIIIKDENGLKVDTLSGNLSVGIHEFTWNAPEGTAPGTYTMTIEATSANDEVISNTVFSKGIVTSIENLKGEIYLVANGILIAPNSVSVVKEAEQKTKPAEAGSEEA